MGDMNEEFRAMEDAKKERHNNWFEKNMAVINKSKLAYRQASYSCLVFGTKNGSVSFYPHTGRWRFKNKTHRGGAKDFISWYTNYLRRNYGSK